RGVDGSTKLDCREVVSAREHARDLLSEKSYRAVAAAFKSCAHRLQSAGVDLAGYTLPERIDDLDAARSALGYRQIDLLSESAGTRTAMVYAWRYPQRIHRSVMLGVNPPGNYPWAAKPTAARSDGSGAWFLSLLAQLAFPRAQVWGDVAAVARNDAAYARGFFTSHADHGSVIGSPGTDLIWAGVRLLDSWPASPDENEYTRVQDSKVETLLIGGSLDFATPPQNATRELLPHLSN